MRKKILSLVAAIVAVTATYAQSTLVATLTHGDNVTMFYGTYALRDAHNAAESGDIINLSGGAFQGVDITKAVTLRGTGIDATDPTYILHDFRFRISEEDPGRLSMEGIRCPGTVTMVGTYANPYFLKCEFSDIIFSEYNITTKIKNATYVDCKITGKCESYQGWGDDQSTQQFINCYIGWYNNEDKETSAAFMNCIIRDADYTYNSQFGNCIIYTTENPGYTIPSSSIAINCVAVNYEDLFSESPASSGCSTASFAEVFKTFTGTYSDAETFELTDAAKTQYLGKDGTQVGLYGGVMPYTSTPSYPQITTMNVANKTTADGKLSVEIEVSAAQ